MFKKDRRYSFGKGLPSRYYNTNYFTLRYQKNEEGKSLCAVVVGKKVDKKASTRNRLKRQFTHALKEILTNNDIHYDLVFYLKNTIQGLDFQKMKQHIEDAIKKSELVKN